MRSSDFWETAEHQSFVDATDPDRAEAFRDLVLLASLADDILTNEERVDIALSFGKIPGIVLDFDSTELVDHIDDLHARKMRDAGLLVADLAERLGEDEAYNLHALRIISFVVRSHGFVPDEERFVRLFATLVGLEPAIVDGVVEEIR